MDKMIKLLSVLLLASLLLTGCMGNPSPVDETYTFQATPVKVVDITSDQVYASIYAVGEITSTERYTANAMTSGKVLEVFFDIGDDVEKDQVLFTIETEDFEVDKSKNLTQASNAISQAKLSFDNAQATYNNIKTLYDSGASSKNELDNVKLQMDNARISYNNAIKSYEALQHTYESQGDNFSVTAPVSGQIVSKTVAVGMFATTQNGFTIDKANGFKINTQVSSKAIKDVEVGQMVEVYVSTLDLLVMGEVTTVSQAASAGTYPIEIKLTQSHEDIKPGMFTDLWIVTDQASTGLWIPAQALIQASGESFVYKVNEDLTATRVNVDVIALRGDTVAIKGDLSADAQLITLGKEYVMNGAPVRIIE